MVLMLVIDTPFGIADQAMLLPAVTIACVYFWSLFRPAAMPPPVVFVIGLLLDLLSYLPPGVGVLTLLVTHGLTVRWRPVLTRQSFPVVWLVFAGFGTGGAALSWVLTALLSFQLLPLGADAVPGAADRRPVSGTRGAVRPGTSHGCRSRAGMRRDPRPKSVFTRRALLMMGGQVALLGGLATRLYQVQVVNASALRDPVRGEPDQRTADCATARAHSWTGSAPCSPATG